MIKILEENEPALLVTCYACLSKFTLDKQDIKKLDNSGNIRGVHCPVCGEWTSEHLFQRVPKKEIEIMIKRSDKKMNKEVKELIDTIETLLNEYSPETSGFLLEEYVVDYNQLKGLLDYINGLEERIEYLERSNNRREETIIELRNEVVGSNE